jgi:hypothetical protein
VTRPCPICGVRDGFHDEGPHRARGVDPAKLYFSRPEPTGEVRWRTGEPVLVDVWRRLDGAVLPHLRGRPA